MKTWVFVFSVFLGLRAQAAFHHWSEPCPAIKVAASKVPRHHQAFLTMVCDVTGTVDPGNVFAVVAMGNYLTRLATLYASPEVQQVKIDLDAFLWATGFYQATLETFPVSPVFLRKSFRMVLAFIESQWVLLSFRQQKVLSERLAAFKKAIDPSHSFTVCDYEEAKRTGVLVRNLMPELEQLSLLREQAQVLKPVLGFCLGGNR